ncbi:MAG: GAF domain-containing protein [Chryseolinea sp.]
MTESFNLTEEERNKAFRSITDKSDRIMVVVLLLYFVFGLFLSLFYDTWMIAVGVGGICLIAYFVSKMLLPETNVYQYVMSAIFAIFSAQFIYQMHGMFEMHFFFFVGSTLLITYRNWKLILPLLILTVIHHSWFAWLQYSGMKEIYFTQLSYMDFQTFLFHALLAAVIIGTCGYWSYDLGTTTLSDASKNLILEKQLSNVKNNISFAEAITNGDLANEYSLLDEGDDLGKSLIKMRDSLKLSHAREEEEKFITIGITKVGDIIRQHSNDPAVLADEFIKGLVKYVGLNQGGLFLHEVDEKKEYLKLAACYAFDRKKHVNKELEIGESLVGQCFQEREPIYLTSVPKDYIKITSGLGEATPQCVYLVPVMTSDEIAGVIELASFNLLKEHEKQFIHKAAENIASAIISSRTTHRIKLLLADSEQRTEEMRSQEEEMRQNMEELQATQEEMARKQSDAENRMKAINDSGIAAIEFNLQGNIIDANDAFLKLMGYNLRDIQGHHHRMFVDVSYAASTEYNKFWTDLGNGITRPGQYERITRTGDKVHIQGAYSILRDHTGKPIKVIKLATDITSLVKKTQREISLDEISITELKITQSSSETNW